MKTLSHSVTDVSMRFSEYLKLRLKLILHLKAHLLYCKTTLFANDKGSENVWDEMFDSQRNMNGEGQRQTRNHWDALCV